MKSKKYWTEELKAQSKTIKAIDEKYAGYGVKVEKTIGQLQIG